MKLLQLYYTSCKRGRGSGTGFQVYSASEGLTEEEIQELERICLYIPPNHLPSQPTAEEIERDFPVAFSYFRLHSGRVGICQSVYVGKDYSERYGNYFSHALVLEEGEWPFSPIFMYGSPLFRKSLTVEELEIDQKPQPLAPIELSEPNGVLTLTGVQQFLRVENRYEQIEAMLNGLMGRKGKPETLVLAGKQEEIPYWIAALHLAFPIQIANQITFSTYVFDPDREDFVISTIIPEGTRFSFHDVLRRTNMYGFDFERKLFSDVKERFEYPKVAVRKQLELRAFSEFFQGLKHVNISKELDDAYYLFTLLHTSEERLDAAKVRRAIQFASKYASLKTVEQLLAKQQFEQLIYATSDMETAKNISAFLIKLSTKNPKYREKAVQFLLDKVQDFVTDGLELSEIRAFLDGGLRALGEPQVLRQAFLAKENLLSLESHLMQMKDVDKEDFYLQVMLEFLGEEGKQWRELSKEQKAFILKLGKRQLASGRFSLENWHVLVKSEQLFAGFLMELSMLNMGDTARRLFLEVVHEKRTDKSWVQSLLQALSAHQEGAVFVQEWYGLRLENSKQKTKTLLEIEKEMTQLPMDYIYNKYVEEVTQARATIAEEVKVIVGNREIETMLHQRKCLEKIYDAYLEQFTFSDRDHLKNLDMYKGILLYLRSIQGETGPLELLITTIEAKKQKAMRKNWKDSLIRYGSSLADAQLEEYFVWCLPDVLELIYGKRKADDEIIQKLVWKKAKIFLAALQTWKKDTKLKYSAELFVDIYLGLAKARQVEAERENLVRYMLENSDDAKKAHDWMRKNKKRSTKWEELYEEVESQRGNSIVRSLKKMFGSRK